MALSTGLCGQNSFILPLKEKVFLTGNFGEIRPNHFHAGLDFKTHPKKNLPIYCVADGYVSRIKVGTHGYGKVLYITHPRGKVSVYGHQYSFNESIKKYVQAAQEERETFEVELFPKSDELKVKQGEIIGYTGNTGDSEGPHLHFEIRDEKSEVPLNPLRFVKIMDTVAPVITSILFFHEDPELRWLLARRDTSDTIRVAANFGVGVQCYDLELKPGNKNNISKIELYLDSSLYYRHILDSIPFDMARYVNTYSFGRNYKIGSQTHRVEKFQKCFVEKNNDLPIYKFMKGNGFINLDDTSIHQLKIKVYDFFGRSNEWKLIIKRVAATKMKPIVMPPVNCLKPWQSIEKEYRIEMLEKTLYKDVFMTDSMRKNILYFYAKDYNVPLHKSCIISMKAPGELEKYGDKLCITDAGGSYYSSTFDKGWVNTTTKNFGTYVVSVDTIAPKIKFVKPKNKKKKIYKTGDVISFKVSDGLSGIGPFKMYVNDKFQLAEYEHKTNTIFFEVTDKTPKGKLNIRLEVSDKKNNKTVITQVLGIE